jgi:hypothetical protein
VKGEPVGERSGSRPGRVPSESHDPVATRLEDRKGCTTRAATVNHYSPKGEPVAPERCTVCTQSSHLKQVSQRQKDSKAVTLPPSSLFALGLTDPTPRKQLWPWQQQPEEEQTIGQHLVDIAYDVSDTTFYGELSDGEFAARSMTRRTSSKEDKWIDSYPHRAALRAACVAAIRVHDTEPYLGRRSLAKVMGTAMGLLKSQRIKAPGGWYPAMKKLRSK